MKLYHFTKKGQATSWVADKLPIIIIIVIFLITIIVLIKQKAGAILRP